MKNEPDLPYPYRRRSPDVTPEMAARIKSLLDLGMTQHDIAALFKINQGRVSEINTGLRFPGVGPSQLDLF
jgi:transcriptional regulator with XRE-family HTH domain